MVRSSNFKLCAATLLLGFSAYSLAEGSSAMEGMVHFKGKVEEPSCTISSETAEIVLDTVSSTDFGSVGLGATIDNGMKPFNLQLQCPENDMQNRISLYMEGRASKGVPTALENQANPDSGVGFEVFTNDSQHTMIVPNTSIPGSKIDNMRYGKAEIPMYLRYAKIGQTVTAGDVASDVTFTIVYK